MHHTAAEILDNANIKPTPNRILVTRSLLAAESPLSLLELEKDLQTLDRSSISRVLALLLEHGAVHAMEDGRGITKYEICHGEHHCSVSDMHAHFYCERCNRVFCFEDINAPEINIPDAFQVRSVNFMIKGICPDCHDK
ncbi:MAG: transcriptional repressor [Clostridiales bacterium]|nr:transcriptional repressor [Clostridiales bacterium]